MKGSERTVTVQVKAFSCVKTPSAPPNSNSVDEDGRSRTGSSSPASPERFLLPGSSVRKEPKFAHVAAFAGVVRSVAAGVNSVGPGQRVFGVIPMDTAQLLDSPAEITLNEFEMVQLTAEVSFDTVACVVRNAVKAFTALSHLGHLEKDDTVMITGGVTPFALTCAQLAKYWGARVLLTSHEGSGSRHERDALERDGVRDTFDCLLDLSAGMNLRSQVRKETGGQGVDLVIDDCSGEPDDVSFADLVHVIGVGGRIVTTRFNLELPENFSKILFLKSATLSFLFDHVWTLTGHKRGKYLHILSEIDLMLSAKVLRPALVKTVPVDEYEPGQLGRYEDTIVVVY